MCDVYVRDRAANRRPDDVRGRGGKRLRAAAGRAWVAPDTFWETSVCYSDFCSIVSHPERRKDTGTHFRFNKLNELLCLERNGSDWKVCEGQGLTES